MQNPFDFALAAPEITLLILAAIVLLLDAFNKTESRHATFTLSIGVLLVLTVISLWQWNSGIEGNSRSEEHTSELQSLMSISYAVFCLKKKQVNKRQKCIIEEHT